MEKYFRYRLEFLTKLLISLCVLLTLAFSALASDWHNWRGPYQNGVSPEVDLPDHWSPDPSAPDNNLIWKLPFGGRSTPLVMNGHVYLINSAGDGLKEQERVMCFDADTGKPLWEHRFNVFFTDIVSVRLGWTVLAGDSETGNVYAHGTQGLFFCFDKDGKVLWSRSLTEEYGRISGYGGRVTSPLVDGNLVIIGMLNASWGEQARGGNRFLAMDKRTGTPVWWASTGAIPKDTYYSVPVAAVINGERLMISGTGDGAVCAFKIHTGEKVWGYTFADGGVNCSPVVDGTRVYIGHGEENLDTNKQGRIICLDAAQVEHGKPKLVWERTGTKIKFASPVIHEGRLYVCDDSAQMYCLDAATGKLIWRHKYGRNAKGSPVWADGKIYIGEVNAKFHILKPEAKSCKELDVQYFPSPDGTSDVEINGSAAVANGRVYFMTRDELFCIGKKEHGPGAAGPPADSSLGEYPPNSLVKPAALQIIPADVVLEPGESVTFKARGFNTAGDLAHQTVQVNWSLGSALLPPGAPQGASPPPLKGQIGSDGKLTVAKEPPGQFGTVEAKVGGLIARARVRVAPRLPHKPDFKKIPVGRTPGGWVNCQGKFAVQDKGGSHVLVKLAQNASPLVARANAYISVPTLRDYTIQADVLGKKKGDDMPDLGVVANRYTLQLDGVKQRLRILSWEAVPRVDKSIDWSWKPDVWYRLKLTVELKDGVGVIKGKAWQRDAPEPSDWTIEFTDPIPNEEGSPALYGYATGIIENQTGCEIYYDNVIVTPNHK